MTHQSRRPVKRRVPAVMALLLLAAACGDDATTNDATPVPSSSTPTTLTTTTVATTTTAVTTTTTTIGGTPWTTVPDPGMPVVMLAERFGGPRVVETLCLEVALTGTVTLEPISPEDLAWTMEHMGVAVVDQGCDVTFAIEAHGERYSAEYVTSNGSVITCFNGTELSGELSLSDGTEVLAVWPAGRSVAPPEDLEVTGCLEEDRPLPLNTSGDRLPVVVALVEAFGLPAAVVSFARLQEFATAGDPRLALISSADDAGDVLAAALHHPEAQVAGAAAERIEDWTRSLMTAEQPYPQRLWDLTPHLIAYGATVGFDTDGGYYAGNALIELLFGTDPVMDLHATPEGFDRSDPAAWWRKWEESPEHPPGS